MSMALHAWLSHGESHTDIVPAVNSYTFGARDQLLSPLANVAVGLPVIVSVARGLCRLK